jgi:peptidoglycan/LPS O-acetylase OafA/YrhL
VLALRDYGLTFDGLGGFVLNLMLVLTVTGILSALTYRYIEAPALKVKFARREDPRSERKPPSSDVQAAPRVAEPPPVGSP